MDHAYSYSAYNTSEEQNKETLEHLRLGNNDKNSTYELYLNTKIFWAAHKDWDRLITQAKAPPEEFSLF